jgi:shikimate 5-dehydrogenase
MIKDFQIQEVDWDQDLGPSIPEATIISSHSSEPPAGEVHLKWSPVVKNWTQLDRLYAWWDFDRESRSFLPRSENDRIWTWMRLFLKGKQKLNFVQFFGGSASDQPTWPEWIKTDSSAKSFAAVLGHPISHSMSPEFHHQFFAQKKMNFFALDIEPFDFETAFGLLNELGLCACAVTSPLKAVVADFLGHHEQVMNTLYKDQDGGWICDNTDQPALEELLGHFKSRSCVVWGGGAMQSNLRSLLSKATEYSASQGRPRSDSSISPKSVEILIWAAEPLAQSPSDHGLDWAPAVVYDLNYREDSMARAYAKRIRARYVSGEELFIKQALRQQDLWKGL